MNTLPPDTSLPTSMNILCLHWNGKQGKLLDLAKPEVQSICEIHNLQSNPSAVAACAAHIHRHTYSHSTWEEVLTLQWGKKELECCVFLCFSKGYYFVKDFQVLEAIHGKLIQVQNFSLETWYTAMVKERRSVLSLFWTLTKCLACPHRIKATNSFSILLVFIGLSGAENFQ